MENDVTLGEMSVKRRRGRTITRWLDNVNNIKWPSINSTSRVPVEGKSSVCVICMKYRIIIVIIIIIISGGFRLIKDFHRGTQCAALAASESKRFMLAFVLYYRSSATTSRRTYEQTICGLQFPMHFSRPRFCIPCIAGLSFPALVVKCVSRDLQDSHPYKKVLSYPTSTDAPSSSATPNVVDTISLSPSADA